MRPKLNEATPHKISHPSYQSVTERGIYLLETLSQISSHPGYLVELFSNYDCDINAENLFDKVLGLLTKVDAKKTD
jgi:hypothetical protein